MVAGEIEGVVGHEGGVAGGDLDGADREGGVAEEDLGCVASPEEVMDTEHGEDDSHATASEEDTVPST